MKKFGFDPTRFGLHSQRIGGTTDMFQNKVSHRLIDIQGRWKSSKTKYRYARDKRLYLVKRLQKQFCE